MGADLSPIDAVLEAGVVFVLRGDSAEDVVETGLALAASGATALEVTWTVPDAARALAELKERSGARVGMGTVTSPQRASAAAAAGADFLVTPGFHVPTVQAALEVAPAVLPGVATPGEVMGALELGLDALKWFPATAGPPQLASLAGPFPQVRWVPSGGIGAEDAGAWLTAGATALGIGGSVARLAPADRDRAVRDLLDAVRAHRGR